MTIKKTIDIKTEVQQDTKIILATYKLLRYRANTITILKKNPNAANIIVYFAILILLCRFENCFSH
jgi:hypothetical protein